MTESAYEYIRMKVRLIAFEGLKVKVAIQMQAAILRSAIYAYVVVATRQLTLQSTFGIVR